MTQAMTPVFKIYVISDATGELANHVTQSALEQFQNHQTKIIKVPKVKNEEALSQTILAAKNEQAVIVFTFARSDLRQKILEMAKQYEVIAIDVLGPLLSAFSNYFHELPSNEPGLQYKLTQNYFKRTEAIEFTVKHDDGLGLETVINADVVLLGVSRTSKTPLSVFLAYQGYRCANVPLVKDLPAPKVLDQMDPKKMVGLTISPQKLMMIRSERLKKLGRPDTEIYAQMEYIRDELAYAHELFKKYGTLIVDVTGKAIEEIASEIVATLKI